MAATYFKQDPSLLRNFCMLAHVDHGKTTLSDFLLAYDGVLSSQLAGKVRFLDSREDEQERWITMKASSIALHHTFDDRQHVINLVDSPGHIDFSAEVSTAIRLCDGALILIDLVDGVTTQTAAMLRQVYREGVKACIVLNKVDLLITKMQLSPEEAYQRMRDAVETCNATLSAYCNQLEIAGGHKEILSRNPPDGIWFCPSRGNVVFASCFDGWGFSIQHFASIYEKKLGISADELQESLWGPSYLDPKTRAVLKVPKREGQKPMAIQLILDPLWTLYNTFVGDDADLAVGAALSVKIGVDEQCWNKPHTDERTKLGILLQTWLPLARNVMDVICRHLPSPVDAQPVRLRDQIPGLRELSSSLRDPLLQCSSSEDSPTVAYVAKLIDTENLAGHMSLLDEGKAMEDCFVGFARVYSGILRPGMSMYVTCGNETVKPINIGKVFLLRGRGLEEVDMAPAGCICGIGGIVSAVVKHATFSSVEEVPTFRPPSLLSTSIVRHSVSPVDPAQLPDLIAGLQMLNRVDPQVEVIVLPTGEHVIGTAGEVHAERCVKDLSDLFARNVRLTVSEPLVMLRETVLGGTGSKPKSVTVSNVQETFSITISARQLPPEAFQLMSDAHSNVCTDEFAAQVLLAINTCEEKKKWTDICKRGLWSFGPKKLRFCGALLMDGSDETTTKSSWSRFRESVSSGFELAACAGTMAEEPLFGVAFVVENISYDDTLDSQSASGISGQIMSVVRDACRGAMDALPRRVVEPIHECTVYSSGQTQGKIYGLLSRRRSVILDEVLNEGSDLFSISCHLPVIEAFGLQNELRIATHGAASAQLRLSHWGVLEMDPYYKPTTREEIEAEGTVVLQNLAAQMIEKIRRRKGIHRENVIESAEKQKFSMRGA